MSNREKYRQKALYCLRAADGVHGSSERLALLSLAGNYMALANFVAGHEAYGPVETGNPNRDTQEDN